jgi:hypothetical protein
MPLLPATGSEISMGRVNLAYNNQAVGTVAVSLSATLGPQKGLSAGTQVSLSSTFGGATTPYTY